MKARDELRQVRCTDQPGHDRGPYGFNVVGGAGWTDARYDGADPEGRHLVPGAWSTTAPTCTAITSRSCWRVPVILPMCDLGGHVYGCYHSSCDDIHLVNPRRMVDNVRFVGMLAYGAGRQSHPAAWPGRPSLAGQAPATTGWKRSSGYRGMAVVTPQPCSTGVAASPPFSDRTGRGLPVVTDQVQLVVNVRPGPPLRSVR